MTKREFLNAVIDLNASVQLTDFAKAEIAKLDKRNATPTKAELEKRAENERIKEQITQALSDSGVVMTAAAIAQKASATTAKVSALLRQMSEAGTVVTSEVKIKGRGKVKGYALATESAEVSDPVE